MIETLVLFLQNHILPWGATGVFAASVIEEVIAPIPSALVVMMSGFFFVKGAVSVGSIASVVFKVALPAAFGTTIGSYFIYFLARYGGRPVIGRWGRYIGLYITDLESFQMRLSGTRKDEALIAGARVLPFVPSVAISAFCGILEMNVWKYFVITIVGVFVRSLILGVIGWQVGSVYDKFAEQISQIEDYVFLFLILSVILFFVYKIKTRNAKIEG